MTGFNNLQVFHSTKIEVQPAKEFPVIEGRGNAFWTREIVITDMAGNRTVLTVFSDNYLDVRLNV